MLDGTPAGAPASTESMGRAPLPPVRRQTRPSPSAIDLTGPVATLAATSARVTARLQDLTFDDDEAASTDTNH